MVAASTAVLWLGVPYFGRMSPFPGNAFLTRRFMAPGLTVTLIVIITVAVVGAAGYLIDKYADRHDCQGRNSDSG